MPPQNGVLPFRKKFSEASGRCIALNPSHIFAGLGINNLTATKSTSGRISPGMRTAESTANPRVRRLRMTLRINL